MKKKGMISKQWALYQETLRIEGIIRPDADKEYSVERTFDQILELSGGIEALQKFAKSARHQ